MINIPAIITNLITPIVAESDPFAILNGHRNSDGTDKVESLDVLTDMAILLRRFIIGAGVVMFIVCLISILLIRNNERMYEEAKNKIIRILVIVWLASSAVTIFTILMNLSSGIF